MRRREFLHRSALSAAGLTAGYLTPSLVSGASARQVARTSPEAQGVASSGITSFLDAAAAIQLELHSFMMMRHAHVVAETWWTAYRPQSVHALYSLSKSFTSTAVGLAVAEGKLKLNDRIVNFFPDRLPPLVSSQLAALEVRHLLSMSVGHKGDSLFAIVEDPSQPDWVKNFLALPIDHAPGSVFLYDTGATFMLSAILQKVCGETVEDYLRPRLFAPLDILKHSWDTSPLGIDTGGWGLSVTTEALAKFGQLYLQEGRWNGRQVLPAQWVEEATSFKIQQPSTWNSGSDPGAEAQYADSLQDPIAALEKLKQSSDWYQGYAYQFWRCRHNAYRGDGAFGQLCVVMPDEDAVVVITSETGNMQSALNLIWNHLLPAMQPRLLTRTAIDQREFTESSSTHILALPEGESSSPTAAAISTKRFMMDANPLGISEIVLNFHADAGVITLKTDTGSHDIAYGLGRWVDGETTLPGEPPGFLPRYSSAPVKLAAAGAWHDADTFLMRWQFYETPHHDSITCHFAEKDIRMEMLNSITEALGPHKALRPETRPVLTGRFT